MADDAGQRKAIAALAEDLESVGCIPVLVGGMALAALGSRRITRDFDFLISLQESPIDEIMKVMHRHNLRLITKLSPTGDVVRTVDNARVARARVKLDLPQSLLFYEAKTDLRVDLLIDFPLPARDLARRAARMTLQSGHLRVAAPEDLLRLKEIAYADRKAPKDAQDLEFLRALIRPRSKP